MTITNAFQKILNQLSHKPIKLWVNKGSEFYNRSMNWWLQDNDIEMYLMCLYIVMMETLLLLIDLLEP